jgi:hypothetical protein
MNFILNEKNRECVIMSKDGKHIICVHQELEHPYEMTRVFLIELLL